MIAIVSSHPDERSAFSALCESRTWVCVDCDSLRSLQRLLRQTAPRVVVVRQRLRDGYSDDVFGLLAGQNLLPATKIIVLLEATASAAQEARQVSLGADHVHRDPVRTDVLLEYVARYRAQLSASDSLPTGTPARSFPFAGAIVDPVKRTVRHRGRRGALTPRQVELIELLSDSAGDVATYQTLYSEILGRRFRGDTSNMRVLLGKLDASFRGVGRSLRDCVEVIPKTGYRYLPPA